MRKSKGVARVKRAVIPAIVGGGGSKPPGGGGCTPQQLAALGAPVTSSDTKGAILDWLALFVPLGYAGGNQGMTKGDLMDLVQEVRDDLP